MQPNIIWSGVRELFRLGIERDMHENPDIPNFAKSKTEPVFKKGMVICFKPMLNLEKKYVYLLDYNWTVKT